MKILQISNYYYPHIGGIEQVARDISCAVKSAGKDEVKVFCFNHVKNDTFETVDGVEIIKAGTFKKIASQSLSFSYGKLLETTFEDFKPDVVIFHYPNPFGARYLLKILKKYPNTKLVLYWHLDITKQKLLRLLFKKQNYALLDKAEKIIATSPFYIMGSKYLSKYADKCVAIPCCVSKERVTLNDYSIKRANDIKESANGKTVCFACGRHVPYKGMEYLVRASKLLSDDYLIYIAGQGPLTDKLKNLASGDQKVIFVGKISDEELKAYYVASDIFCFPSITKNEAFGISLAEGMYFGKPSVTFTIPESGVNFVSIGGLTGIEVENSNYVEYAKAIEKLATDEELRQRYSASAKKRVNDLFTEEKFKQNILVVIEEMR